MIKVHVGCGARILKGWVNIDVAYTHYGPYLKYYGEFYAEEVRGTKSDLLILDVTQEPLPFPDNSVDVIFHEDFIEHLDQRGQIIFLAEALRVLKPYAVHRVNTPNLLTSMRKHSDFALGSKGVYIQEWDKSHHLNMLTPNLLEELAYMTGYRTVMYTNRDCSISSLVPPEYRPDPNDRAENGNLFADLIA